MSMEWWDKMMFPMQRVWINVATRFGIRKSGILKLRNDVRTCEYEDVHVMWEMLKRNETELAHSLQRGRRDPFGTFLCGQGVLHIFAAAFDLILCSCTYSLAPSVFTVV